MRSGAKLFLMLAGAMLFCGLVRQCADDAAREPGHERETLVDTLVYVDTVRYFQLIPKDSAVVRYVAIPIPAKNESPGKPPGQDSLSYRAGVQTDIPPDSISLPVVSRHYADSTYEAWVSGPMDPRLDSLYVYPRNEVVTIISKSHSKRWGIGPSVGLGFSPHGFQPFIGISITYSIISY